MRDELDKLKRELQRLEETFALEMTSLRGRIGELEGREAEVERNPSETVIVSRGTPVTSSVRIADTPVLPSEKNSVPYDAEAAPDFEAVRKPAAEEAPGAHGEKEEPPDLGLTLDPAYAASASMDGEGAPEGDMPRKAGRSLRSLLKAGAKLATNDLGPLSPVISALGGAWTRYRNEGRLPVFLMTAAGVIALVFGFGYLLQYSFSQYLGDTAKAACGVLTGCAIIAGGGTLSVRREGMSEFGSALIGLGVIVNYLSIFFLTVRAELVGTEAGWALLGINTLAAFLLALRYTTRIVAVISFLGGAFTPFLLGTGTDSPVFYLAYLWVLILAATLLSRKIRWPRLTQLALATGVVMAEVMLLAVKPQNTDAAIGVIHLYFYLFVHHSLFCLLRLKERFERQDLVILAGAIGFLLVNLHLLAPGRHLQGGLYLANAVPFLALIRPRATGAWERRAVLLMAAGSFAGFAVPALFGAMFMGLFWAQEALALLYVGFLFASPGVRKEGWLLLLVATVQVARSAWRLPLVWDDALRSMAYLNLAAMGLILLPAKEMAHRFAERLTLKEKTLRHLLENLYSLWIATGFMVTAYYLIPSYAFSLAVVPMFYLVHRGCRRNLPETEILGLLHYLLILVQIAVSALHAQSFHFTDQTLSGKVAVFEAFALLWLLQSFYDRRAPESRFANVGRHSRLLFYNLVPVAWLPSFRRHLPEFLPLALWGAAAIAFLLLERVRQRSLRWELWLLVLAAAASSVFSSLEHFREGIVQPGSAAMVTGALLLALLLRLRGGLLRGNFPHPLYQPLFTGAFYYFAVFIFLAAYAFSGSIALGLTFAGSCCLLAPLKTPAMVPIRRYLRPTYRAGMFLVAATVICGGLGAIDYPNGASFRDLLFLSPGLAALYLGVYRKPSVRQILLAGRTSLRQRARHLELVLFQVCVAATYTLLIAAVWDSVAGPAMSVALVVHGVLLLFHAHNTQLAPLMRMVILVFAAAALKVMLLDMAGFSMVQKILAFMGIGIVLLGAAYLFQRARNDAA